MDNRIKVIHKQNGGLSDARNAGLDIAKGDYIGFVDSDDYISPNMYETLVTKAVDNKCEMVACGYYVITEDGIIVKTNNATESIVKTGNEMTRDLFFDKFPHSFAWNKIYKASLFKEIRYPVERLYEDLATTFRLTYKCSKICIINEPFYYYAINRKGNITTELMSSKAAKSYYHHCLNALEHINFAKKHKEFEDMIPHFKQSLYCNGIMSIKSSIKMGKQSYADYCNNIMNLLKENGFHFTSDYDSIINHPFLFYWKLRVIFNLKSFCKAFIGCK